MLGKEEIIHLMAIMKTEGVGSVTTRNLLSYCGSATQIFQKSASYLAKIPGIAEKTAQLIHQSSKNIPDIEKEFVQYEKQGVKIMDYLSADYPPLLKEIDSYPLLYFYKGAADFSKTCISIVGTRKPTKYGISLATELAEWLSENGCIVVSGLASGIDGAAHTGALKGGSETIGVVAHGLDHIYPASHASLAEKMCSNGMIMSEYPLGVFPDPRMFPHRNRIIAGLSRATIVVEAKETGGALITAHLAFDYNRDVFAVPGLISEQTSVGCHQLIRKNIAKILTKPEDILEDLNLQLERRKNRPEPELFLTPDENNIVQAIQNGLHELEPLSKATGLSIHKILSALLELEFKGIVKQIPGNKYQMN